MKHRRWIFLLAPMMILVFACSIPTQREAARPTLRPTSDPPDRSPRSSSFTASGGWATCLLMPPMQSDRTGVAEIPGHLLANGDVDNHGLPPLPYALTALTVRLVGSYSIRN